MRLTHMCSSPCSPCCIFHYTERQGKKRKQKRERLLIPNSTQHQIYPSHLTFKYRGFMCTEFLQDVGVDVWSRTRNSELQQSRRLGGWLLRKKILLQQLCRRNDKASGNIYLKFSPETLECGAAERRHWTLVFFCEIRTEQRLGKSAWDLWFSVTSGRKNEKKTKMATKSGKIMVRSVRIFHAEGFRSFLFYEMMMMCMPASVFNESQNHF